MRSTTAWYLLQLRLWQLHQNSSWWTKLIAAVIAETYCLQGSPVFRHFRVLWWDFWPTLPTSKPDCSRRPACCRSKRPASCLDCNRPEDVVEWLASLAGTYTPPLTLQTLDLLSHSHLQRRSSLSSHLSTEKFRWVQWSERLHRSRPSEMLSNFLQREKIDLWKLRLLACSSFSALTPLTGQQEGRSTCKETGAINRLHFSGAGFWYGLCHANLGPDSSGTRFRRRLQHCSISSNTLECTWLKLWLPVIVYFFLILKVVSCTL